MDTERGTWFSGGLFLKPCRYMVCWSIPFAMLTATPFALVFSYYNTQDQKKFKLWKVKPLGRDLLIFWTLFSMYAVARTLVFDPYCDSKSIHYDKTIKAADRKKILVDSMRNVLESEGRYTKPDENKVEGKE